MELVVHIQPKGNGHHLQLQAAGDGPVLGQAALPNLILIQEVLGLYKPLIKHDAAAVAVIHGGGDDAGVDEVQGLKGALPVPHGEVGNKGPVHQGIVFLGAGQLKALRQVGNGFLVAAV
ncbi:hypothetical protein SDC9_205275 [bioreactor metagenome]|uniref:Uncharacterized protein n=1 Tax=bioreactor metagenome TaxID=1076179 RepID=A0A645J1W5_9ZZZZ